MDLFEQNLQRLQETEAPLAARMRPQTLDQFVGQDHILAPGRLLRRAIQADQLSSLIFYGPPGTGKTTLARIIANTTQAHFIALNAVLAGVKDLRDAIATATEKRKLYSQRTILFVDEVHRFNKSQQDALLPWVENGTVILIGATTENPYFEVNKALVSRSRLFQLTTLTPEALRQIVQQTLADGNRGYGKLQVKLEPAALEHLVNVANGDARSLLNALELAVETTAPNPAQIIEITLSVAEESIQQRAILYDKEGDAHFDTISAFIKSVRGSDPDAALYWLAKMVYGGENPRFILRRLLILASEDVGLADPQAIAVINACAQAFDRVGMPEGRYALAQATLYLALAPKSNSLLGFFDALAAVEQEREADIPNPLKDANRDKEGFGHGAGYLYPHAYRDHWVAQQYLPSTLQGKQFYQPSNQGFEGEIARQVARRREAQIAALGESEADSGGLTYGKSDRKTEQWLQRTLSQAGEQLATVRERIFDLAQIQRHHRILDLNAGTGLLTWEAIRQAPEGCTYSIVRTEKEAQDLQEQAIALPELLRPQILTAAAAMIPKAIAGLEPDLRFDCLLGRNVLMSETDKKEIAKLWLPLLAPKGTLVLAESIPRLNQRIYQLLPKSLIATQLRQQWQIAEEAIYQDPHNSLFNWDETQLQLALEATGFAVQLQVERTTIQRYFSPGLLDRWFAPASDKSPSYGDRLSLYLTPEQIRTIQSTLTQYLSGKTIPWSMAIAFVQASPTHQ
jgi:putative ATPase